MKLAVCLYKYFAYGGLARDFRRILEIRRDAGDEIDVYYIEWHGEPIAGFNQIPIQVSGLTNHARMRDFYNKSQPLIAAGNYDLVIGFNKMPGLDLYYAADPCYLARVRQEPSYIIKQFFGRVRFYEAWERAVFGPQSHTVSMMISSVQRKLFEQYYQTPADRLVDLPPGIDPDRVRPDDWQMQRQQFRQQLSLKEEDFLLLMIGSGFKRKGADFAIEAMAALPQALRDKTHLYVVGEDNAKPFEQLAKKLNVTERTRFMGGRDDVAKWLLSADVFLHPARSENTGTVILEAWWLVCQVWSALPAVMPIMLEIQTAVNVLISRKIYQYLVNNWLKCSIKNACNSCHKMPWIMPQPMICIACRSGLLI